MKKLLPTTLIALLLTTAACAAEFPFDKPTDTRTFEITPAAPPHPALKYQFLFDNLQETRSGNAAIPYHQAMLLLNPEFLKNTDDALAAFNKDPGTFGQLAASIAENRSMLAELDLGGRSDHCDWQTPLREMGPNALLPHLYPIAHGLTRYLQLRALFQIQNHQLSDAVQTLRLGYLLSLNTATDPTLISGLVGVRVQRSINNITAHLMNQPDAPNLYWALTELPEFKTTLAQSLRGERIGAATFDSRLHINDDLSAAQWRRAFEGAEQLVKLIPNDKHAAQLLDPVTGASPELLKQARSTYAQSHHIALNQAEALDPAIPLGAFYLDAYLSTLDDMYKLRTLPYPQALAKLQEYDHAVSQMTKEQPANPFLPVAPSIRKAVLLFAKADRERTALATIEALRAYAAANNGKLPAHLEDVTETPVPQNPLTGQPFDYALENNTATLSDPTPEAPLTYTITLRK